MNIYIIVLFLTIILITILGIILGIGLNKSSPSEPVIHVYDNKLLNLTSNLSLKNPPYIDPDNENDICNIHNLWAPYNDNKKLGEGPAETSISNPACGQQIEWNKNKLSILGIKKAKIIAEDYFQSAEKAVLTEEELFIAYPAFSGDLNSSVYTTYNIRKAFPESDEDSIFSKYNINAEAWSHKPLNFTMSLLGFLQRTTPVHEWTHKNLNKDFNRWNKSYKKLNKHQKEELVLLSKGLFRRHPLKNGKLQSPCWGCSYGEKSSSYNVDYAGDISATLGRVANMFVVPDILTSQGLYGKNGLDYGGTVIFMVLFLMRVDTWSPESSDYFKNLCKSAASKIRWGLLGPLTFELVCEGNTQTLSQPCCLSNFTAGSTLQPKLTTDEKKSNIVIGSPLGGGIYMVNLAVVWHLFGEKGIAIYPGQRMPMSEEELLEACPVYKTGNNDSLCDPQPERESLNIFNSIITDTLKDNIGYLLKGEFGDIMTSIVKVYDLSNKDYTILKSIYN